ncbi:unnamed protein product [Spirodela intermedia]|uniref:Uncharacterized protein n=1 Tax=Spirodela intermedia TaxID=51605 RepID=A0A7I8K4U9_SPIIN|nr:unnamed protein product [Spirodela intermedia]
MKSTHGGCETSFLLSKFIYRKSYLSTIYILKKQKRRKKYSANFKNQAIEKRKSGRKRSRGVAASRGSSGLAWTDRGTCAPLPFHVTGGQPAVGQGVTSREDLEIAHVVFV